MSEEEKDKYTKNTWKMCKHLKKICIFSYELVLNPGKLIIPCSCTLYSVQFT